MCPLYICFLDQKRPITYPCILQGSFKRSGNIYEMGDVLTHTLSQLVDSKTHEAELTITIHVEKLPLPSVLEDSHTSEPAAVTATSAFSVMMSHVTKGSLILIRIQRLEKRGFTTN